MVRTLCVACSACFIIQLRTIYLPGVGGTMHNQLGPPISIINQETALQTCCGQSDEGFYSVEVPIPK